MNFFSEVFFLFLLNSFQKGIQSYKFYDIIDLLFRKGGYMANTDFIWGAVIGCAALWYFTSRDKTSSVEVIPARTIQVNTTPNYITQGSYQVLPSTTYVPSYSFATPCSSWRR